MSKQSNQKYRKDLSKQQSFNNKISNSDKDETNKNNSNGKMDATTNRSNEERNI